MAQKEGILDKYDWWNNWMDVLKTGKFNLGKGIADTVTPAARYTAQKAAPIAQAAGQTVAPYVKSAVDSTGDIINNTVNPPQAGLYTPNTPVQTEAMINPPAPMVQQQSAFQQFPAHTNPTTYKSTLIDPSKPDTIPSYVQSDAIPTYNPSSQDPSKYGMQDYMDFGKGAVDIGGGLMGLYGMYQQNQRAEEAMNMARQDQAMRQRAADQYAQFRADTKSAFA